MLQTLLDRWVVFAHWQKCSEDSNYNEAWILNVQMISQNTAGEVTDLVENKNEKGKKSLKFILKLGFKFINL